MSYEKPPVDLHPRAVGFVAYRVAGGFQRLALYAATGALSNTFGIGETRADVAAMCERHGLRLLDDDAGSVIKAEG